MTKKYFTLMAATLALVLQATPAHASISIVASSVGGQPMDNVNYVTFNSVSGAGVAQNTAGSADPFGSVNLSFSPDAALVTGPSSGLYAPPVLSSGNGAHFDSQGNGVDATQYVTSGKDGFPNSGASATITFNSPQQYFGLLWGSVDDYNTLKFYNGATLLGTFTGVQVTPDATGDQGIDGTFYVNFNADTPFDRVVATSSEYAFEFDNIAYSAVPEATTILVWSGLSLIGCVAAYRRRSSLA